MEFTFIYTLTDPNDNQVKYIGKTDRSINVRLSDHMKDCKLKYRSKKTNWIISLKNNNQKPIIEVLDIVSKNDWVFWEEFYISLFKSWGFDLKNTTDGGEGCKGFKHSNQHKENLKLTGNFTTNNPNKKGCKLPLEVVKKIQETKRIKKSLGIYTFTISETTRKKLSDSKKQYFANKKKDI